MKSITEFLSRLKGDMTLDEVGVTLEQIAEIFINDIPADEMADFFSPGETSITDVDGLYIKDDRIPHMCDWELSWDADCEWGEYEDEYWTPALNNDYNVHYSTEECVESFYVHIKNIKFTYWPTEDEYYEVTLTKDECKRLEKIINERYSKLY